MFTGCFTCRPASTSLDHCSSQSTLKAWTSITVVCSRSMAGGTFSCGTRRKNFFPARKIEGKIHDLRLQYLNPTATPSSPPTAGTGEQSPFPILGVSATAGSRTQNCFLYCIAWFAIKISNKPHSRRCVMNGAGAKRDAGQSWQCSCLTCDRFVKVFIYSSRYFSALR